VITPDTQPRPLRADARRNRQRVLEVARGCFARDGMQAQIDEIAAGAEVGVGTVYRHFPTKEALLDALAEDYFTSQALAAEEALQQSLEDPWRAFTGYMRGGAALMAENRALAQIASDRPATMQRAAEQAQAETGFFDTLETLIARAQDAGALRRDFQLEDVPAIMCSLGSLNNTKGEYANWRRLLELILDGLRAPGSGELPPHFTAIPRGR